MVVEYRAGSAAARGVVVKYQADSAAAMGVFVTTGLSFRYWFLGGQRSRVERGAGSRSGAGLAEDGD